MADTNKDSPVIFITGANRGVGLAILTRLATNPRTQHHTFVLGCRSTTSALDAITSIRDPPHSIAESIIHRIHVIELDLANDDSIHAAVAATTSRFNRLDILINNAGIAAIPNTDNSDYRQVFQGIFDINVTAIALLTTLFLPLLRASAGSNPKYGGRVINIASARASIHRAASGVLPPSVSLAYDISKAALNKLTVGMAMAKDNQEAGTAQVEFQCVNPGHCKTAFNGFRGLRDPLEGADVVVEILGAEKGGVELGCWETLGNERVLRRVEW